MDMLYKWRKIILLRTTSKSSLKVVTDGVCREGNLYRDTYFLSFILAGPSVFFLLFTFYLFFLLFFLSDKTFYFQCGPVF